MSRWRTKQDYRDANEPEIIRELQARGVWVHRIKSTYDPGVPDLLCGYRAVWFTVEVKQPQGKYRPFQEEFAEIAKAKCLPHFHADHIDDVLTILEQTDARIDREC